MKHVRYGFALLLLSLLFTAHAAEEYFEGFQYARINPAQPTAAAAGKVEVVEMFWYGCPHCYSFEPHLQEWLKRKPANVEFVRIPAIFGNKLWRLHATAYYTAEALGVLDKVHEPLFEAIHKGKRKLDSEDELAELFARHGGVEKDKFRTTFHSFTVQAKVGRAADLSQRYGLSGVPALVVNGKFRTDGPMAQTYQGMLNVVDHLVAQESGAAN